MNRLMHLTRRQCFGKSTCYLFIQSDPEDISSTLLCLRHIPKSGGTTVKRVYQCMGRTLAHRFGVNPKFGHEEKDELVVFTPADKEFSLVNVDTTVKQGILRAKELGLVPSRAADLIFTMEPGFAGKRNFTMHHCYQNCLFTHSCIIIGTGEQLYDENNRGRLLTLFRHPVDRVVR